VPIAAMHRPIQKKGDGNHEKYIQKTFGIVPSSTCKLWQMFFFLFNSNFEEEFFQEIDFVTQYLFQNTY
jgi:hypothetical protein